MNGRHGVSHTVESQEASRVVHINPDTGELLHIQRGFHVAVPGGEGAAVPLETPGEVVSCDAAVALVALAVDALVGQTDVCALAADVCLKVVPPKIEALRCQNLAPVLEPLRYIRIRMLPGRGVSHLPVFFCQAQELVSRVSVETQVGGIWERIEKMSAYLRCKCYIRLQSGLETLLRSPRSHTLTHNKHRYPNTICTHIHTDVVSGKWDSFLLHFYNRDCSISAQWPIFKHMQHLHLRKSACVTGSGIDMFCFAATIA